MRIEISVLLVILLTTGCSKEVRERNEVSLNGMWKIAVTDTSSGIPSLFSASIPVPGLIDMARPAIEDQDTAYINKIYWYKRMLPAADFNRGIVRLKINKARYHTRVWVNGEFAGENPYNFTASLFDIKPFLKSDGTENELIIAVGCWNNLPDTVTNGWDFEKMKYIPGIYDDVKIIISDYPYIRNVQVAPDLKKQQLRVAVEVEAGEAKYSRVDFNVREAKSGKPVISGAFKSGNKKGIPVTIVNMIIRMDSYRLWSPEDPFLYDIELKTGADSKTTRFGMRTFESSPDSGVFLLNGKPYYIRGTNVCIYRFFEDPERNDLPWNSDWVTKLHGRFKEMYWDGIRYCIGFPPERWYEIADSLGFLIQDEFPLWTGGKGGFRIRLGGINSRQLAAEYLEWMRERWNHPCVVVWDAQNESVNDTTGRAISMVRGYDLSSRPWDNGWAAPDSSSDAIESHPYLFSRYQRQKPAKDGYLKELFSEVRTPGNDPNSHSPSPDGKRYSNPVILNEYGWIWLNRNGSTTTLTDKVYENVWPWAKTAEQRLEIYGKTLGILTEYWRSQRNAAAVMHFCGLGYSRAEEPRGQTSDHFVDLKNLTYESNFYKYVRPAFSPVGIFADFWETSLRGGQKIVIPVHLINDTYSRIEDNLNLKIFRGNEIIFERSMHYDLEPLGKIIIEIPVLIPDKAGNCMMEAIITYNGESVKSIREFIVR
jgi:hypothetical protein